MKVRMIKAVIIVVATVAWVSGAGILSAAETGSEEITEPKAGGVTSIEDRIEHLEQALGRTVESDRWYDRLQISGLIEVEAAYQKVDFDDPAEEDTKESDVDLASVELDVDARIVDHVDGHVLFKYEDDDLFVDEGFIIDSLELAVRYGGADDGGNEFLPETQYGAVVNWGLFENTNLALEYIHDEYEDDFQEADIVTAQLAIEF
jgi:hypothetical protein